MLKLPEVFEPFRTQFEASQQDFVYADAVFTENGPPLPLTQSKFFGYPYLPKGFTYPLDVNKNPMALLAQINFDEAPPLDGFPTTGILQFFITNDDMMGMTYEFQHPPIQQHGYRVIYHANVDETSMRIHFSDIPPITDSKFLDVQEGSYAMSFEKSQGLIPLNDEQFRLFFEAQDGQELIDPEYEMSEEDWDTIEEEYYNYYPFYQSNKMGGYPGICQHDIRGDERYRHYVCLLQISLETVFWSMPSGLIHFFIDPQDLKNSDFSKVIYYWSCT